MTCYAAQWLELLISTHVGVVYSYNFAFERSCGIIQLQMYLFNKVSTTPTIIPRPAVTKDYHLLVH